MINIWYRLVDLILPYGTFWVLHWFFVERSFFDNYHWFGLAASGLLLLTTQVLGGYDRFSQRTIARKLEVVFKGWLLIVALLTFTAYLLGVISSISRLVFVLWVVLVPFLVILSKILLNRVCLSRSQDEQVWLLLGSQYSFTELEQKRLTRQKIKIVNLCHRNLTDIKEFLSTELVKGVILNVKEAVPNELVQFLTRLELSGTRLYSMNHFFENYLRKSYISYDVAGIDYLDSIHELSRPQYFVKRVLDIASALTLFILIAPIMLYAVKRIKKDSPGPVIFKQSRVGAFINEFDLYKFRSMHLDAEAKGAQFATEDDPRAYPFGAKMRKTRIDELPQLWNVLKGDLHFIGPRPERLVFTEQLEKEIPFYHERHLVKPGITGWAQVMYPYGANTEDARQKLMYDLYYIKHWSIWLEFEVLIRTVLVVLGKKGL